MPPDRYASLGMTRRSPVIASTRKMRGDPTLHQEIASADFVSLATTERKGSLQ